MKQLKEHLYREQKLELWCCGAFTPPEISDAKSKESEPDFRARLRPKLPDALASAKDELEKSYAKKLMDAQTKLQKAQNAVSSRRWQFWAKLGSAVWVVFDTVMAGFGKNMPGRRRSLDPALRGIATETSSSSNAKLDLERARQSLQQIQQEKDDKLKQLEVDLSENGLKLERLAITPQKGDIEADEVSLMWFPFRISPTGAAEPVYSVENQSP
jgi:hypothetical protein